MLARRGVRGVLAFVAVLIGLVALWEGLSSHRGPIALK